MKLNIIKERLKEAIGLAERITSKNASLAILNSVILEAEGSLLSIKATNLEVGIEIQVPAKIDQVGSVAVNGQVLVNFLNNLYKEDKVNLEIVGGNISISTTKGSTLLKSVPIDDFPSIPHVTDGFSVVLTTNDLVANFKAVVYAAAVSDIKPEIASVYLHLENKTLIFVATDSFRLAEKRLNLTTKIDGEFNPIIIPLKNALEIIRIFDGFDDQVTLQANKHQLSIYTNQIHFTSRLLDGIYPDYQQIIAKNYATKAVINRQELLNALKLTNVFSDRLNQVELKINPTKPIFELSSKNQDIGENTIELEANLSGDEVALGFNAKYLLDCFSSLAGEEISLCFNGPQRPLTVINNANQFTYLVMPVRR